MKGFKREPLKKEKNTHMAQNGKKEKKNCSGSLGSSGGNYFMFFLSNTFSHEALHSHKRSIYFWSVRITWVRVHETLWRSLIQTSGVKTTSPSHDFDKIILTQGQKLLELSTESQSSSANLVPQLHRIFKQGLSTYKLFNTSRSYRLLCWLFSWLTD